MKQGDVVLIWGATGGLGGYAVQYVLNGGGIPVGVVSSAPTRSSCCTSSAASTSSTARQRATSSGPTSTPRTRGEWRRLGKDIRAPRRRGPDIVFEHPGRQTMGASVFVVRPRRHGRHLRGHQRLHDRVRQPPPLDEAEVDQVEPLRQLPGGVGGQPADRARARSSRSCRRCTRSTRSARPRTRSTTTCTRARSACCAWRPRRAWASTTPSSARRSARTRSPCSGGTRMSPSRPQPARRRDDVSEAGAGRPAAHRDRPRRHRRQRPRRRHRLLPRGVRRRWSTTARSSSPTASRRPC